MTGKVFQGGSSYEVWDKESIGKIMFEFPIVFKLEKICRKSAEVCCRLESAFKKDGWETKENLEEFYKARFENAEIGL